ncbi:MAG: hypothetical protein ABSA45_13500 [Verrucomicrobiota bacterium]
MLATIYGGCKGRDAYRVAWQVPGRRRRTACFPSCSLAQRHADRLVKELAKGSQVTALNPVQARDALAALERLEQPVSGRSGPAAGGASELPAGADGEEGLAAAAAGLLGPAVLKPEMRSVFQ